MRLIACAMIAVTLLAACENTGLRHITSRGEGPDEFIVVPSRPLEQPDSFAALPTPTPGGFNRTDQRPLEDSVAALGGQRTSPNAPIPGADGALVNHASRFGRDAAIRGTLATADAEFRRRQGRSIAVRRLILSRPRAISNVPAFPRPQRVCRANVKPRLAHKTASYA